MTASGQAIRVAPSGETVRRSPVTVALPKKRLHEPLPATLPGSGNSSVART
jgi:hypothetical protein